jgi:hypothetical protein
VNSIAERSLYRSDTTRRHNSASIRLSVQEIHERRPSTAVRFKRLRAALAWLEVAPGQPLEASQKAIVSKRPANALGGAQPPEPIHLRLAGEQVGEAREAIPDRRSRGQSVVRGNQAVAGATGRRNASVIE